MIDLELTLDENESAKVHFYHGKTVKSIFLWAQDRNTFSIAVSEEGEEKHVIEIHANGEIITTKKDGIKTQEPEPPKE